MKRTLLSIAAGAALVGVPIAASAVERPAQPANHESGLVGGTTLFFVAGIAVVVAAIFLLPEEDDPVSA